MACRTPLYAFAGASAKYLILRVPGATAAISSTSVKGARGALAHEPSKAMQSDAARKQPVSLSWLGGPLEVARDSIDTLRDWTEIAKKVISRDCDHTDRRPSRFLPGG